MRPPVARVLLAGVASAATIAALTAAVPATAASTGPAASTTSTTSAVAARAAVSCGDVLVVGLDGNGERPRSGATFGPTVARVVSSYTSQLGPRSVRQVRVPMNTQILSRLVQGHQPRKADAGDAVRRSALRAWQGKIGEQVALADRLVSQRYTSCPEEQVVLVGYAQGASVAHRLLDRWSDRGHMSRIAGAVLVSDPDRRYNTRSSLGGAPPAARASTGLVVHRIAPPADDVPASNASFATFAVCTARDLVCDPSRSSVRKAFSVARSYATAGGRTASSIRTQAGGLAARTRVRPVPAPATQTASGPSGEALRLQLAADVTSAARSGVRWTATSSVPGFTLSPEGVLSGTPTTTGTWTMSYTVRGTTPATPARSGSVTIVATAALTGASGLSAAGQSSCQTRRDGTAYCWGRNDYGQVGDGTTTRRYTATKVNGTNWRQVAAGGSATCGITSRDRLWCWGLNNYGQLGIGQTKPQVKPRAVGTGSWRDVSVAWHHACGVSTGNRLYCWGQNLRGSVGTGSTSRAVDRPRQVDSAAWRSVTTGGWHSCGIRTDGTAWCWGDNALGQLGVGNDDRQTRPKRVGTATDNWLRLSTGYGHSCGIRANGSLHCWGLNDRGQLGDGTTTGRLVPTPVAGGGTWSDVAVTDGGTCAVAGNGAVWCWGDNRYGQVATASAAVFTKPTRRAAPTGATMIAGGWLHACAARADQSVSCWGSNEVGQRGNNNGASARRTTGSYDVRPGIESDPGVNPAEVVRRAIGDRPRPTATQQRTSARRASTTTRVMTFNQLGTLHTAPGGTRPDWAPSRIRAEWASEIIRVRNADLIGTQETNPDQVAALDMATRGAYGFYPGTTMGYSGATGSVMWRKDTWSLVWSDTVSIPFMNERRPRPMVRLRHKRTGQEVYLVNVHFSPGQQQDDRNRGAQILIRSLKQLAKDGLPILLTGDFNEREGIYCKIHTQTNLRSSIPPAKPGPKCHAPRGLRVDQIFGARGRFGSIKIDQGPMVQRTTDHSVSVVPFTVG
jgi:alpha-tubulin suppressor-like RCC1 family protein/endonuclease/exonuclease/phosphatase family metal-dependent hydrolase